MHFIISFTSKKQSKTCFSSTVLTNMTILKVIPYALVCLVVFSSPVNALVEECPAPSSMLEAMDNEVGDERRRISQQEIECHLYLAESTIAGAGLGIFSAVEKRPGDKVGHGDVCIPVIDLYWHNYNLEPNPLKDYFWAGKAMGMHTVTATEDKEAYCPGLDCAINCHLGLINVGKSTPQYDADAGDSSTPYHNGTTEVTRYIPAGGELFKFYGDSWFVSRERIFGKIPLSGSYDIAMKILKSLRRLPFDDSLHEAIFDLIHKINTGPFESRQLNAFPPTWQQVKDAMKIDDLASWQQPQHTRSVDWLKDNGRCIDHIRPGRSEIAGRGAFATRFLPRDTIITTSPLHHFPDNNVMKLYNITLYDGDWIRLVDEVVGQQLLVNYCFGHHESTLLLCPYGSGVNYINHSREPNVRIQWATTFEAAHNHDIVTQGTIESFKDKKPAVAFDYVAIRDIQEGEELFIDYGDSWQQAWEDHQKNFKVPDTSMLAVKYNELVEDTPLRTVEEQRHDPYPSNLQMRCHKVLVYGKQKKGLDFRRYLWQVTDYGESCRVLERFEEEGVIWYTIEVEVWDARKDEDSTKREAELPADTVTQLIRTDVPRSAIRFFDIPQTTPVYAQDAFRHFIEVPDDLFPKQWRNLVQTNAS
jgi:hypothetical protein